MMLLHLLVISVCFIAAHADDGYFWHVTDFHYDFSYSKGDLSCNDNVTDHGVFGDFWCDSPWRLIASSVEYMKTTKADADFMLWTGDSVLHVDDTHLSVDINNEILSNLTKLITGAFPSVPVYATFGNHDYYPSDQYPPHGNEIYNKTFMNWDQWIGNSTEQEANFKKGGYYTLLTSHGLRIVALNTNLYYTSNKQTKNVADPADQMAWLKRVLYNAKINNETKVMVVAHIPTGLRNSDGKSWMYDNFNSGLNQILRNFSDIIVGTHYGHEHIDTFRIFYKEGKPAISQFCAPSVTPWRYRIRSKGIVGAGRNPAVRLVKYDRTTGRHLNYVQHYMDLKASNRQGTSQWKVEYDAKRDYGIPDLTPESLHKLLVKMNTTRDGSYQAELSNFLVWQDVSGPDNATCDNQCFALTTCSIAHVDQVPFDACVKQANAPVNSVGLVKASVLCMLMLLLFKHV